ncbi:miniconductance mechanosensitive channel MscM [Edwardsiella piscicida]|uniref:miniconductance mechanosensitive channel MscM n=1 Tax=Edwardsiella piscicida TaxID=1263550 RepID=UPI0009333E10|nr:miniconductance mechanosensitive channel MscM [Edwardsiella piscicida]EKS7814366.1 miniconductance mechanosensitive channel MscM [Edwardsiella piscicida]WAM45011.1 miniconductance mechanosensitive channel MscM [Edwardsiella piscicida]
MRQILQRILLSGLLLLLLPGLAQATLNERQLALDLKQAEAAKSAPAQAETVDALQSALGWIDEAKASAQRTQQYRRAISDFPRLTRELRQQLSDESQPPAPAALPPAGDAEQRMLQISSQLLEVARQLQQEQDRARDISDSLSQVAQKQAATRKALSEAERRLQALTVTETALSQAQSAQLQAEVAARKAQVDELELEQLSANNRQELIRLQSEVLSRRHERLDLQLQGLRNSLNSQRQRDAEEALERTRRLVEQSDNLPRSIVEQLTINQTLSRDLNHQAQRLDDIAGRQRTIAGQTQQVRLALNTLREQAQWLSVSPALGETLRDRLARLPEMPKPQQLDSDMARLRVQRLRYEALLDKLAPASDYRQNDGEPLSGAQQRLLAPQLATQRELLNSLLSGCDSQILELTKLKVANTQLIEALTEVREATHRYLFWAADIDPVGLGYLLTTLRALDRLLSLDTLSQLSQATMMMLTDRTTLLPLCAALLLVGFSVYSRRYYSAFLARAAGRVGKVNQDHISLTLRTLLWSILVALPLPVLWAAVGYGLSNAWPYPVAVAIGEGVSAALPVLWAFMISAAFSRDSGLFIVHFGWGERQVRRAMRYYRMSIWLIVPLLMAVVTFNNLADRSFTAPLGRACFIMLCLALLLLTTSLRRAGIPLYLNRAGSGENLLNHLLWGGLLCAPAAAILAALLGYLGAAQVLLARLETSVAIWFCLLMVYSVIRRWMLIQRRRIAFERAKQRRAERLEKRSRHDEDGLHPAGVEGSQEVDESVVDLDAISERSLRLVRSILTMIALVSLIWLWSELHSAFAFLENIRLWDVTASGVGGETLQPITLGAVLIAILVILVTIQLVKNLPALLELGLLQHLELSPGTGYAITTITKYLLMIVGGLIGFSLLGIEWSKLQWLVAALTVGLGFGLGEIFGNFISGLIILFEKPIRIGDTVTIRDLTGTITRINTRATTISDWDRKEIIVPNKAFIMEQFINWSLSDPITRVVLTVPAEASANSQRVTELLLQAAGQCSLVLATPAPEVYLVDIQQGIQIFELRIYASEMAHRMPLRHELHQLILAAYRQHDLVLPFPPIQIGSDSLRQVRGGQRRGFSAGGV